MPAGAAPPVRRRYAHQRETSPLRHPDLARPVGRPRGPGRGRDHLGHCAERVVRLVAYAPLAGTVFDPVTHSWQQVVGPLTAAVGAVVAAFAAGRLSARFRGPR